MIIDGFEYKTIDNKEEVDATLSFFKRSSSQYGDEKIWEWEFNSLPNTVLAIVKNKHEVAGTQFMLPIPLHVNGQEALSGRSEGTLMDTQYRGNGLFPKLYAYAEEISLKKSMLFLWAFTAVFDVFERMLDFTVSINIMNTFSMQVGMPNMSFLKSPNKSLNTFKQYIYFLINYGIFTKKYLYNIYRINYSKNILKYEIKDTINSFKDFDNLYNNLRLKHGNFAHIKIDKTYFDWRIKNNINLEYTTVFFYVQNELVGYYIFSISNSCANVSDFTSLNSEVSDIMVCHLLKKVKKINIFKITYLGNINNELNKNNFNAFIRFGGKISINEGLQFVYKNISSENINDPFLQLSGNWYLNGLCTEGFAY